MSSYYSTKAPLPMRGYTQACRVRVGQRVQCHGTTGVVMASRVDLGTFRLPGEFVTLTIAADNGGILSWYMRASDPVRVG